MTRFTAEQLAEIIEKHRKWRNGEEGGERADLSGADLSGADLSGANLSGVDLSGANLSDADLSGADLSGADLSGADLSGADLSGANLSGADLSGADLSGADLIGANLSGANLSGANLSGADLPKITPIENLDAKILSAIDAGGSLKMCAWHTCETTHCRAGWAINLAGGEGRLLESLYGPSVAGALIYAVSRPGKAVPDFHCSNKEALADLRWCAGVAAKTE